MGTPMPELPEVEALRRYLLASRIPGRIVTRADAVWPGVENTVDGMAGLSGLAGRKVESIERLGKQLLLPLDRGVLGLHMGMTGRLVVMDADTDRLKYMRYSFHLDDGRRVELDDVRRWASARLVESADELTVNLGPDTLDPAFTAAEFCDRMRGRRAAIKTLLMDQSVLAGVGNIYADEALHRAGIHPARRAHRISRPSLERLHQAIVETLETALRYIEGHPSEDGSPFVVDAYDGRMRLSRKPGSPCPDCGRATRSRKFGGRTAYYCPGCQH